MSYINTKIDNGKCVRNVPIGSLVSMNNTENFIIKNASKLY
jgi:hypothetical protein